MFESVSAWNNWLSLTQEGICICTHAIFHTLTVDFLEKYEGKGFPDSFLRPFSPMKQKP
jgi:hypothetical protein